MQFNLGLMYVTGVGVEQDHTEAVRWIRLAADRGHTLAQHNLWRRTGPSYNAPMTSILEGSGAGGLRVLSLFMGAFLVSMAFGKIGWFTDSSFLVAELRGWWGSAPALSRWYIDTVAMPGAPLFARLVLFGELASGAALVAGFRVHLAAGVALLMVLNFHFASGVMFQWGYLTNGFGLPVVGGLAALALGARRLPFSILRTY